jgi:hypothetical protein
MSCAREFRLGVTGLRLPLSGEVVRQADIDRAAREAHAFLAELCDDHGGCLTGRVLSRPEGGWPGS